MPKKIAVFTGNRADYGLLRPVIKYLAADRDYQVTLIVSGSHLSADYGRTMDEIDVTELHDVIKIELTGLISSLKVKIFQSYAKLVEKGGKVFDEILPNALLIAGDRYETFAVAVSAFYGNIPIAHIFGGDLSQGGHLDDSARHAVTKLAHIHFTTNEDSYKRVMKLGEEPWRVHNVGSPFMDTVFSGEYASPKEIEEELGLALGKPFILFTQHPVTTETNDASKQVRESLEALKVLKLQTIITYPCSDAGSEAIIELIREYEKVPHFIVRKSLGQSNYIGCLKLAACVVGNSSSGLMETPIFKVPFVNIGSRQSGRLRSTNVIDVGYNRHEIQEAIQIAISDKGFLEKVRDCPNPYGDGNTSKKIAGLLKSLISNKKILKKQMTY